MPAAELTLPEAILLLSLHNEKGSRQGEYVEYALAGAGLADLLLTGYIRGDEEDEAVLSGTSRGVTGDTFLDRCLEVVEKRGPQKAKKLIERIVHLPKLRRPLLETLVARGILREEEKSFLFFKWRVHPTADPTAEAALISRLETVLFTEGQEVVDAKETVLIALAHHTGLLQANLGRDRLKEHKDRIETIAEGGMLPATAAIETIKAVRMAVMVAVFMPVIVTTVT